MERRGSARELVGREAEVARLRAFLEAEGDGARFLVLEGEPGIGKTALWRVGVDHAAALGFRVLAARPAVPERELAFAALGDLLAGLGDEIGRLPAPQRRALRIALVLEEPVGVPPGERAIAVATLELLRRASADAPLVIALDDVQWLDAASAAVLAFVLRRLDGERAAVLATVRPGGGHPLANVEGEERLVVGPLSLRALGQLLRGRLGARLLRPTLRQIEQTSGGNPFYALELAASLLRSGRRLDPGEPLHVPAGLRELVGERLATLTPSGRWAALAAAAMAHPTESALRHAADGDADALVHAIAAGVLVRDVGETVRFAHPLLASALYDGASSSERRRVHRRLASVVRDDEEQARHLAESVDEPDEAVAEALESAAASAAARGVPDAAAQLAKRAVELTPRARPQEHKRRLVWARYVRTAGDPARAKSLLESQLEHAAAGRERAEVALELGDASFASGGSVAARTWYEAALNALGADGDVDLRTRALVELAGMDLADMRVDSGRFEQALTLAEALDEPALLARALGLYATKYELSGGQLSEEYWRRALVIEAQSGELRLDGPTHAYGNALAFSEGQAEAGAALLRRVAESMRQRSDPALWTALLNLSDVARNAGDWSAAEQYIGEAFELVVQTGLESQVPSCLVYEGRMAMLRGDFEVAQGKTYEALRLFEQTPSSDPLSEGLAHSVLGRAAFQSGRLADAQRHYAVCTELTRRSDFRPALFEPLAEQIACLVVAGELEQATRGLRELTDLAGELMPAAPQEFDAVLIRTRALLLAARGNRDAALTEFGRAIDLLESLPGPGWPYELARTLFALGNAQRRARQKLAAREALEHALEIFERLGARVWADKTRAELSLIAGRPGRSGGLTATEQQIADLVAAGRSNAEVADELFISPKTVEWNLSKIYKKLHVRSRSELASKRAKQLPVR